MSPLVEVQVGVPTIPTVRVPELVFYVRKRSFILSVSDVWSGSKIVTLRSVEFPRRYRHL